MADWDADTMILKLEFDNTKTSLDQILKKLQKLVTTTKNTKQLKKFMINSLLVAIMIER
jgi:hypothetical protein